VYKESRKGYSKFLRMYTKMITGESFADYTNFLEV